MGATIEAGRAILIVDDDPVVAGALAELLREHDYEVLLATRIDEAVESLSDTDDDDRDRQIGVMILDSTFSDGSAKELIRVARDRDIATVPIVVAEYGTIESAVETIRLGAADYLTKPLVDEELLAAVDRAYRQFVLVSESRRHRDRMHIREAFGEIIGDDPRMRSIFETVTAVATSRTTVLMTGESGTGKSLIARSVHQNSKRRSGPFVEISCGSIPETLLESELFGHVKGAFTGAHADKKGRFLAADGGTIFLDEINSASPAMQMKLLRVLQDRQFEPVGSTDTVEVDVRILLATNEPLESLVAQGTFRQDLYYRINVVAIDLPPLRERPSDIPILAGHFLRRHAEEAEKEILGFTDDAMRVLCQYSFPGNIRELENIVERAVVLSLTPRVEVGDLPDHVVQNDDRGLGGDTGEGGESKSLRIDAWKPMPLAEALREPERRIILAALEAHDWNRQSTADALQINRSTLYKKMKEYDLDREHRRSA